MRLAVGIAAGWLLAGCATTSGGQVVPGTPRGITFGGGDGVDCARRVIIQGAQNEQAGVGAEYAWLRAKYPGYRRGLQALTKCDGKPADKLSIQTAAGQALDIYFDISGFFGKGFGL
jgi:hypothetical protein